MSWFVHTDVNICENIWRFLLLYNLSQLSGSCRCGQIVMIDHDSRSWYLSVRGPNCGCKRPMDFCRTRGMNRRDARMINLFGFVARYYLQSVDTREAQFPEAPFVTSRAYLVPVSLSKLIW